MDTQAKLEGEHVENYKNIIFEICKLLQTNIPNHTEIAIKVADKLRTDKVLYSEAGDTIIKFLKLLNEESETAIKEVNYLEHDTKSLV